MSNERFKKANITSQSTHWWITIRKNIVLDKGHLKQWCDLHACNEMYAFIEHKNDISPNTGEMEGTHYHIVLNTPKRYRKGQLLNELVDYFELDNPFGIEVDIYRSFEGCIQYLTHQNESTKTPHDKSEIITNIDKDTFNQIIDTPLVSDLTATSLQALIIECKTPLELGVKIGLGTYDHYFRTIKQWWKIIKGDEV